MNSYTPQEIQQLKDMLPMQFNSEDMEPSILRALFRELRYNLMTDENLHRGFEILRNANKPGKSSRMIVDLTEKVLFEEDMSAIPVRLYEELRPSVRIIAKWRLTIGK